MALSIVNLCYNGSNRFVGRKALDSRGLCALAEGMRGYGIASVEKGRQKTPIGRLAFPGVADARRARGHDPAWERGGVKTANRRRLKSVPPKNVRRNRTLGSGCGTRGKTRKNRKNEERFLALLGMTSWAYCVRAWRNRCEDRRKSRPEGRHCMKKM